MSLLRGCRCVYKGSCKTSCLLRRGRRRVYRGSCKTSCLLLRGCRRVYRGVRVGSELTNPGTEAAAVGGVLPDDLTGHFPAELLQHANGSSRVQGIFEFLCASIGDDGFVQVTHKGALTR